MLSLESKKRLEQFLMDDAGKGDITGSLVPEKQGKFEIVAEDGCTLAGVEEAAYLFELAGAKARVVKPDGTIAKKGDVVISCEGSNRAVFLAERTVLNVLARMSGVATVCSQAAAIAAKASGGKTLAAATRKTLPGFNDFDKKACRLGGADSHRTNLSDMALFKTNELAFFKSPKDAVDAAKKANGFSKKVELEAASADEAVKAAVAGADIVMLDNFSIQDAKIAIAAVRAKSDCLIEISGGVNLENLAQFAALRPDFISMGLLTQKAPSKSFGINTVSLK
ncbi:MAG: carboxylating nicotinate-nucleotide diphosphorylase [Candidatus Micrarchaeia archaeon]|jgi:nicotinate-nucleotide pyrophosphorylase (carboxylating)